MSVQATFCATLVDEWVRLGVTDAVVRAGSRSTPLALPVADRLRVHVRLDERSGGFFALGLAMDTGEADHHLRDQRHCRPENCIRLVVEAHHARVPLIVCTADRPPELHHTGAPQSIEQNGLFAAADPFGPTSTRRGAGRGPGGDLETTGRSGLRGGGPRSQRSRPRAPESRVQGASHRHGRTSA